MSEDQLEENVPVEEDGTAINQTANLTQTAPEPEPSPEENGQVQKEAVEKRVEEVKKVTSNNHAGVRGATH